MLKRVPLCGLALIVVIFAVSGPSDVSGAQNRRGAAAPTANEIDIMSASFGAGQRKADVTARVRELVRPRGGLITANAATLRTDPAPGAKKQLRITYQYRGGTYQFTVGSGQTFYYSTLIGHAQSNPDPVETLSTTQALSAEQMASIVIIEGDDGDGTGFIAQINGTVCVVTNLHVLGDNEKLAVKTLKGDTIAIAGISGAVGADIALLRVANPAVAPAPLVLASDLQNAVKIGAKIVVVGNRLGGGVLTQVSGQIKGLGPAKVEVDARFQPGNSGSPIMDSGTQQVIGVAAYTSVRNALAEGLGNTRLERRWFGYRLDTVARWQTIEWSQWQAQIKQVGEFHDASNAIMAVLMSPIFAVQVEHPALRSIIRPFDPLLARISAATNAKPTAAADLVQLKDLFRRVRVFAESDVTRFAAGSYYDFFHTAQYWETNVTQQTEWRQELIKALKSAENSAEFHGLLVEQE